MKKMVGHKSVHPQNKQDGDDGETVNSIPQLSFSLPERDALVDHANWKLNS